MCRDDSQETGSTVYRLIHPDPERMGLRFRYGNSYSTLFSKLITEIYQNLIISIKILGGCLVCIFK